MRILLAAALALIVSAPARAADEPRNVDLVNRSVRPIVALRISPASAGSWGPDLLDAAMVRTGATTRLRLPVAPGQCFADVRVGFAGGDTTELRNIDLCHLSSLTVDDEGEDEEETVMVG